jgi:uncharacterized coiled-coil protein SlyX
MNELILKLLQEINAKLDALHEQGENHEEDIRMLSEKVEAMDTSYGSGMNTEDYGLDRD